MRWRYNSKKIRFPKAEPHGNMSSVFSLTFPSDVNKGSESKQNVLIVVYYSYGIGLTGFWLTYSIVSSQENNSFTFLTDEDDNITLRPRLYDKNMTKEICLRKFLVAEIYRLLSPQLFYTL